jgi:hypothetical protein
MGCAEYEAAEGVPDGQDTATQSNWEWRRDRVAVGRLLGLDEGRWAGARMECTQCQVWWISEGSDDFHGGLYSSTFCLCGAILIFR